jgi:hypothetical protein
MTWRERRTTPSAAQCCVCDRVLNLQELDVFYDVADEELHGEVYCPGCVEERLVLCPECSGRYTAGERGVCGECTAKEYVCAGEVEPGRREDQP